ncbi:hypothetical protein LP420_26700 [Massilia sp. B-10]|nr:hypothetical protein LP420_26700 [Massilia sp. B-10]
MFDDSGKSTFSYDDFGRLRARVQTVGNSAAAKRFSLQYEYGKSGSGTGHIVSMTYPSGNRIDFEYGVHGKVNTSNQIL